LAPTLRVRSRFIGALLAGVVLCAPSAVSAQPLEATPEIASVSSPCPPPRVEPSSNLLVRTLTVQYALLSKDVCKILNWSDRFANIENLVVHLFTGPGLHPTAGIVVPESGAAGGLALNLEWNEKTPLYERLTANVEGRASEEGFWALGTKLQALLPSFLEEGKSPRFIFSAKHFDLPRLPYYGLGNGSSLASRALYGVTETEVSTNLDVPMPLGFTLSGELDGLWFDPSASRLFDTTYDETSAPGLRARPIYMRPRVSVAWKYPRDETLYGFSTSATATYGFYGTLSGGAFSFGRVDARWTIGVGLDREQLLGAFNLTGRLVISDPTSGNRVPFYLQPTLGGGDIHDENLLRSYRNYRFRDSNLVAYEISYERRILDPFGIRVFAQLGKVGREPDDLGFDNLKSSAGFSATFRLGGATVFEISFAWGGGEGMRTYATGNSNNIGGVTAGLRGVF
jgi:hypothetical protein